MNNAPPPPAPTPGARSVRLSEVPLHAPIAKDSNRSGETRKMQEQQGPLAKLHPSIASLVERVKNKRAQAGADEAKFVRDGKAEIQVWLFDKTPEALLQLKRLGFEVVLDPKTSKLVIGRLSIEKLEALAQLKVVRFVSPQT
jgi:hypothetical protein